MTGCPSWCTAPHGEPDGPHEHLVGEVGDVGVLLVAEVGGTAGVWVDSPLPTPLLAVEDVAALADLLRRAVTLIRGTGQ